MVHSRNCKQLRERSAEFHYRAQGVTCINQNLAIINLFLQVSLFFCDKCYRIPLPEVMIAVRGQTDSVSL